MPSEEMTMIEPSAPDAKPSSAKAPAAKPDNHPPHSAAVEFEAKGSGSQSGDLGFKAEETAQSQPLPPKNSEGTPTSPLLLSRLRENRIVAPFLGEHEADTFRRLRTLVLQRMSERDSRSLGICSAQEGEGKSLVALNLAISLAFDVNHTVLLVELDFCAPHLHEYFDCEVKAGLADFFRGDATVEDCLYQSGYERLTILPARTPIRRSSEIIASPMMGDLARELRNRYPDRIIIYDMPPLLFSDDCLAFMGNLDAFLFVVGAGRASADDIDRALSLTDNRKLIGTVLNGSQEGTQSLRYHDAYR